MKKMKTKLMILAIAILALTLNNFSQRAAQQETDTTKLAQSIAGEKGTSEEKSRHLVNWINTNFEWSYTVYQKRSPEEIIRLRSGNCADLAGVLALLLSKNNIEYRWIHEVNIQPKNEDKRKSSDTLIASKGNSYSVFGFQHNDHVWLEVFDEKSKSWFPADPAIGVVGIKEWISARMAFNQRRKPQVPEVAEVVVDMLVPFAVAVFDKKTGKPLENRSEFYVIESFNKFYGNKLQKLPSWNEWKNTGAQISPFVLAAFAGEKNLHEQDKLIDEIAQTYEKLKSEAESQKIVAKK